MRCVRVYTVYSDAAYCKRSFARIRPRASRLHSALCGCSVSLPPRSLQYGRLYIYQINWMPYACTRRTYCICIYIYIYQAQVSSSVLRLMLPVGRWEHEPNRQSRCSLTLTKRDTMPAEKGQSTHTSGDTPWYSGRCPQPESRVYSTSDSGCVRARRAVNYGYYMFSHSNRMRVKVRYVTYVCNAIYIYDKHVCTMYVFMCVFGVIVSVCVDVCKATLAVQNWCCPMFQHCEFLTTSAYSNREYTIHKQAWRQPRHNKRKLFWLWFCIKQTKNNHNLCYPVWMPAPTIGFHNTYISKLYQWKYAKFWLLIRIYWWAINTQIHIKSSFDEITPT